MRLYSLVFASVLLAMPASLYANSLDFHGFLSLNEIEFTNNESQIGTESLAWLWLKTNVDINEDFRLKTKGWIQAKKNRVDSSVEEELLEAYLEYYTEAITITAGRQIIAWGRADSLNPTDNLTPRNYGLPLLEDAEQRFGADSLIFKYSKNEAELSLVLIGKPKANLVPLQLPANIQISDDFPENPAGALKLNVVKPAFDWSVSYYDGFDLMPNLGLDARPQTIVKFYDRKQIIGTDAATTIGPYGIRVEAAYSIFRDEPLTGFFEKHDQAYWILGVDRSITENININLQVYGKKIFDFSDENTPQPSDSLGQLQVASAILSGQLYDHDSGLTLRIYNKWLNETLTAELLSVYSTAHHDRLFRARVNYAINDKTKFSIGLDRFAGSPDTFFGNNEFLSFIQAELKLLF